MINPLDCLGLDESRLVKLCDTDLLADSDAAAALSELIKKALSDGFSLDVASAYRSFSRQCAIFDAKWNGLRPVLDEREPGKRGRQRQQAVLPDVQSHGFQHG